MVGNLNDKAVAAAKGVFVGNVDAGDHHVDALVVQGGKAGSGGFQEFVTGVFHVVLIVGIIDHALQVTFVVPYFHLYFKCVIFHGYKPNDSLIRIILIRFLGCDFSVMVHVLHRRSAL